MSARHFVVCVKSVVLDAAHGQVVRTPENSILNPFDRPALAIALELRQTLGGTVTTISMGPPLADAALRETIALGADRAVLLSDRAMAGADTLATAAVLAAAVKKLAPVDLVLFGTRTADSDTGQVGPLTATALHRPLVTDIRSLTPAADGCRATKYSDGFLETYALPFPGAVTVRPEAAAPGEIHLGRLENAFSARAPEVWDLRRIGLGPEATGIAGSPTVVAKLSTVQPRKTCRFIDGDEANKVDVLVQQLVNSGLID